MVEVAGRIDEQSIFVFIDPSSSHNYIVPRVVDICAFKKSKHNKSWLVQLANGTKRRVSEVVEKCPLVMDVDVIVTLKCIHLYILCIVPRCLFGEVSVM